jgi:hypothetical protein
MKIISSGIEINGRGDALHSSRDAPVPTKVVSNFADQRRPLGRYS